MFKIIIYIHKLKLKFIHVCVCDTANFSGRKLHIIGTLFKSFFVFFKIELKASNALGSHAANNSLLPIVSYVPYAMSDWLFGCLVRYWPNTRKECTDIR